MLSVIHSACISPHSRGSTLKFTTGKPHHYHLIQIKETMTDFTDCVIDLSHSKDNFIRL